MKTIKACLSPYSKMRWLPLLALIGLTTGCPRFYPAPVALERTWQVEYKEELIVMTEPPGAKIYVEAASANYVGISPATATLGPAEVRIVQSGHYMVEAWKN